MKTLPLSLVLLSMAASGSAVAASFDPAIVSGAMGMLSAADGGMVRYENRTYAFQLAPDVAYQVPFSGDIKGITRFTFPFSLESEHHFVSPYFGGGILELRSGSLADETVRDPWMLEIGFAYRFYFTGSKAFFSPYVTADISGRALRWTYRNPIQVDGDTVRDDAMWGINGYSGVGIAVHRRWRWTCFGEIGVGGMGFVGDTEQKVANNLFDSFGYVSVKAGVSVRF